MSAELPHKVIIVPGLGDDKPRSRWILEQATNHWSGLGLEVVVASVFWRDGNDFEPKLLELVSVIDQLSPKNRVSLVGVSAGASLAFNALLERPYSIFRGANCCGRLRAGKHVVRSLENMARTSPAFFQSVEAFEKRESQLTTNQRAKLLTVRPLLGDELVPRDTAYLEGASNRWIYSPEHMLSIFLSLKLPIITSFLLS